VKFSSAVVFVDNVVNDVAAASSAARFPFPFPSASSSVASSLGTSLPPLAASLERQLNQG